MGPQASHLGERVCDWALFCGARKVKDAGLGTGVAPSGVPKWGAGPLKGCKSPHRNILKRHDMHDFPFKKPTKCRIK